MKGKKIKRANYLTQKKLSGEKFNIRAALLTMRRGQTGIIERIDADAQTVRVAVCRYNKQGLGNWEATTVGVPTGIMVTRIK
jgi:hypothetical protein